MKTYSTARDGARWICRCRGREGGELNEKVASQLNQCPRSVRGRRLERVQQRHLGLLFSQAIRVYRRDNVLGTQSPVGLGDGRGLHSMTLVISSPRATGTEQSDTDYLHNEIEQPDQESFCDEVRTSLVMKITQCLPSLQVGYIKISIVCIM